MAPGRGGARAVEDADVVETEEPAGEEVLAFGVLAIHPPREVEQQLLKRPLEEQAIALPSRAGHLVDAPARPRVYGRVDVAEGELVRRNLSVGVHVPLAQQQHELLL